MLFYLFWLLSLIIFCGFAYFTYCKGFAELSSAIIGVMGVILCSQIFLTPLETEKYKTTLSIEKKHTAYSSLLYSLNELIEPLNLLDMEERPFSMLTIEEQKNHIQLKSQFADAAEAFNTTFKNNTIYYAKDIRKKIADVSINLYQFSSIFNQISGSKQENKAKQKLKDRLIILSKLIKEIDVLAREELNIK